MKCKCEKLGRKIRCLKSQAKKNKIVDSFINNYYKYLQITKINKNHKLTFIITTS